jgi:outer membrane protein, heavy metal efflux system
MIAFLLLFVVVLNLGAKDSGSVLPGEGNPNLDPLNPYLIEQGADTIEAKISTWSLDQIEKYAISNNPLYLAEKQNIGMARGDLITAALYRNPVFSFQSQFLPMGNSSSSAGLPFLGTSTGGPPEHAPSITQDIDVGGVIPQRKRVAQKALEVSIFDFEDFDRLFRLRLRQNYWFYLYISELINFQMEFYENYSDLVQSTKFRAEKGDISPLEYERILLEKVRIEKEVRDAEILRAQIARDLRFLIGVSPSNQILKLKGDLKYFSTQELGLNIKNFKLEDRPDLKRLQSLVAQNKLNVDLKKKEGGFAPFLNLGGEVRYKGNESYAGIFAALPIKVFDRNQGEIFKAQEQYKKSVLELESRSKQIYAEIRAAMKELLAREELLKTYKEIKLIEKNKEIQGKYRLAYTRGASNLVTFLESERNYLTVLRGYYEQIYLYYNSIENFRAAIGKLGKNDG